jgi:peroxiredoxin
MIFAALLFLIFLPIRARSAQNGAVAPSFSLVDRTGQTISLEHFKGKIIFLGFWGTWCAPCREELPALDKLYAKYRKAGLEVIGISIKSSRSDVEKFLRNVPVNFHILLDGDDKAGDAYRVSSLPTGFLIDKNGVIRYKHMGFGDEFLPLYEKEIVELLKEK